MNSTELPIIDLEPLREGDREGRQDVGRAIRQACRQYGFFYVRGHGVSRELRHRLDESSRRFFDQPLETKMRIPMSSGGLAWRGYFPLGDELTSGRPDQKEGIYFGAELDEDHPRVRSGTPLHGSNLFLDASSAHPDFEAATFRTTVLEYLATMTRLGQQLMEGIAISLGLEADHFRRGITRDPLVLFRIFHYPPLQLDQGEQEPELWSVGEHTDYGLLTLLLQDRAGGLQVRRMVDGRPAGWIDAPPIEETLICNIGDMLDRLTHGFYRSTPHRVLNRSGRSRLSFPFFFDPGWDVPLEPLDLAGSSVEEVAGHAVDRDADEEVDRWDGVRLAELGGTYGDYVRGKVSKVFPELKREVLE